jgi:cell division septation protein DedD
MRDTDTLPINTISTTQTVIPITRPNWVVWGAIFLAVLFAGLLAGLLAGPQLGIGIDPTATPLKPEDASATAFQATLGQENAIARATLQNDLSRVNLAATEISHQLQNLQTRNANLSAESKAFSGNASTLTAELANVQATGTALDILQGTTVAQLENDIISLQSTHASYSLAATTSYRTSNALQTQMSNLLVTIQALYSPTPTSSFTPSPTNTPSPSFTPSSTFTPSPTATPTDTVTPSFTPSPTPTPTDTPTEIPSPTLAPIFGNAVRKVW